MKTLSLSFPVLLSILMVAWPIRQVLQTNTVLRGISQCLAGESGAQVGISGNLAYVTTSPEAPIRMMNNLQLRNSSWIGTMELDPTGELLRSPETSHYIVIGHHEPITSRPTKSLCEAGIATVYTFQQ